MKLKNATFADLYIEKIVLAVAVVVAAAILLLYFVGSPYNVEFAGQSVPPQQVEQQIKSNAQALQNAISNQTPAQELTQVNVPEYDQRFWRRHYQRPNSTEVLPMLMSFPGVPGGDIRVEKVDHKVAVIEPPAPKEVTASAGQYVLADETTLVQEFLQRLRDSYPTVDEAKLLPEARKQALEAAKRVNPLGPGDFASVTISAEFHPQELRKAYESVDPAKAIPAHWYDRVIEAVTDIRIEREELDPRTGMWTNLTVVEPLPGSRLTELRRYVQALQAAHGEVEPDAFNQGVTNLIEQMRVSLDDVTKPQFVPHAEHRPWRGPEEKIPELSDEENARLFDLNEEIRNVERQLRRLMPETGADEATPSGPTRVRPGPGSVEDEYERYLREPDGRGGRPGVQPRPGAQPRPGTQPRPGDGQPTDPNAARQKRQQDRIDQLQEKLDDLYRQRDELLYPPPPEGPDGQPVDPSGRDITGPTRRGPTRGNSRYPAEDENYLREYERYSRSPYSRGGLRGGRGGLDAELMDELPPIKIWAHDVTAKPGKTYRYRVAYKIFNPYLNKKENLEDEHKPLADKIEQASALSDWTKPVEIDPLVQAFVKAVQPSTNTVEWEIYRIYNGQRLMHEVKVRPGDPISGVYSKEVNGVRVSLPMEVPAVLVDVRTSATVPGVINTRAPANVLIADIETGLVEVRRADDDINSPTRKRLHIEATMTASSSADASATTGLEQPLRR